ncbi:MAG: efflux RND transporter periplasmic adaptor subunit [Brevundimonas sp.]|uniref:efflux RND transporter periplasmic adaptor subunit n=1 Tax=Brevundimonas sp. TaxID=1871086 RepID=UPI00271E6A2D|nr:efflux RND transporter periplasmic adaptor subunit [Brevundimonas sp.]MDO9608718.1 efflux RND transporter periplasmic adaptor subunit [Brevundimonas sp.]
MALLLASCSSQPQQAPAGPPQVSVVTIKTSPVTLTTELPGRISAAEVSEVRPQVNGIVTARLFEEGDFVRAGQALYRIDAAPYQAQVASAQASLARARAAVSSTAGLARRYQELVKINGISQQELEDAVTSAQQAEADVQAQAAALRTAQIDLGRTTVRAPISGRIGRSSFTVGALVTASQASPLATIQRIDRVYVDIPQSSTDMLRLRQQIASGALARDANGARVKLLLEDGSTYAQDGTLQFADVTVDANTGSQNIRAIFNNPDGILLPGMFARAVLVEGSTSNAILAPQRAVSRDAKGGASVMVVGADGKLQPRPITTSRTVGQDWMVTSGLQPGDKVVVEGAQNLMPGTPVKASPYQAGGAAAGAKPAQPSAQAH